MSTDALGQTVLPPEDLEAMLDLSRFLDRHPEPAALVGPDGQTVPLPLEAFRVLVAVAAAMREGKAITVAPIDQLLTTQEAADYLGISRPTLVRILERGDLPMEKPGRHRFVRLRDLVAFRERERSERRQALAEMQRQGQEDGLCEATDGIPPAMR